MRRIAMVLCMLLALTPAGAQEHQTDPDDRMQWWREARFGLFIHWGLYSILEGEYAGNPNHAEWIRTTAQIPLEEYDRLLERFNPVHFDADAWCEMAADAGMRYIVITTKHHDGFCLFDSKVSDFDVMSTPFQRDIMKELSEAARRHGLRIGWYHSIMDWHHPDYLPRRGWEKADRPADGADFSRFVAYLHAQVRELLTNYGPIDIMWFDGEWESTWTAELGNELYAMCREISPKTIINNRVSKGREGMAGMTREGNFAGDFGTPEQEVPEGGLPGVDWESCITMNRHWGWNRADTDWKSSNELIRLLVDVASKGGNLLLNVGPKPDGTFPEEAVARLREIGDWMDLNGEAIYGTQAGPFRDLPFGRCTMRPAGDTTTLYLHVFDWPDDGTLTVPGLGNSVRDAHMLAGPRVRPLSHRRVGGDIVLKGLPSAPVHPASTTIVLVVDGAPIVYETPEIEAASDIFVRELRVRARVAGDALEVRYTLDGSDPDATSPLAEGNIVIADTTTVRAASFHDGRRVSAIAERTFEKIEPWARVAARRTAPGLIRTRYDGSFDSLPNFSDLTPAGVANVQDLSLGEFSRREHVALVFEGYLMIPGDDLYRFALRSDDGSRLIIDGRVVVDNDGLHVPIERTGSAPLARGLHRIRVEWFNKTGGADLHLGIGRGEEPIEDLPPGALRHE